MNLICRMMRAPAYGLLLIATARLAQADERLPPPPPPPCRVFWQPDELPAIHQLNFVVQQSTFDSMVSSSSDRSHPPTSGSLTFNDASYDDVEFEVHGGNPQRGATTHSKPSFRINFSKQDPFNDKHHNPFNFPKNNQCNNMDKFVLRGEWNDSPITRGGKGLMIRNKYGFAHTIHRAVHFTGRLLSSWF